MLSAKHLHHLPAVAVVLSVSACVCLGAAVGTSYWLVGTGTPAAVLPTTTIPPFPDAIFNISEANQEVSPEPNDVNVITTHFGLFETCNDVYYQLDSTYEGERWQCTNLMDFLHDKEDDISIHQWKSVIAFELVSTVAIFFASIIATIGWLKKMPLPTLLAGVTQAMADLFMMVGHAMFITAHERIQQAHFVELNKDMNSKWNYGTSFTMAWLGFCLSALAAIVDITMFVCSDRYRENDIGANMPI